jgi:hypothetical protein
MRTAKRTLAGFSSRIGSHGGTHGNESVIDTCHAHKYDGATTSGAARYLACIARYVSSHN